MGSCIPKSECALRCHREAKKSEVGPVTQEAAKRVAGKSEVRSKSQPKAKQEESSEKLSTNCGGRKGMDSIAVFMGTIADHSRRWQQ